MFSAGRTGNLVFVNVGLHLLLGPGVYGALYGDAVFLHIIFNQLIGPEALLAALAVH